MSAEQRARLAAMRAKETDPVLREAYAMAARAGFDWYDTESSARRAFEHAAGEVVAARGQRTGPRVHCNCPTCTCRDPVLSARCPHGYSREELRTGASVCQRCEDDE